MKKESLFTVWLSLFGFSLLIVGAAVLLVTCMVALIEGLSHQDPKIQALAFFIAVAFAISIVLTSIYRTTHDDN